MGSSRIASAGQATRSLCAGKAGAMSVFRPDLEFGQSTASDLPSFQVVLRGYRRVLVDA